MRPSSSDPPSYQDRAWPSSVRVEVRSVPRISSIRYVRMVPSWAFGPCGRSTRWTPGDHARGSGAGRGAWRSECEKAQSVPDLPVALAVERALVQSLRIGSTAPDPATARGLRRRLVAAGRVGDGDTRWLETCPRPGSHAEPLRPVCGGRTGSWPEPASGQWAATLQALDLCLEPFRCPGQVTDLGLQATDLEYGHRWSRLHRRFARRLASRQAVSSAASPQAPATPAPVSPRSNRNTALCLRLADIRRRRAGACPSPPA